MKVTSTEIKNQFGKYLRLCSTEPIYITKNGKTIAKLLNHAEKDIIIEESVNLRKTFNVDEKLYKDYNPNRVAEAMEAYNLERMQLTYEEFKMMNKEAKNRYEFIDGEIYMLASPSTYHQMIVRRLVVALDQYLLNKPCDVFDAPFDVTLLRRGNKKFTNVVQPDVLVACNWKDDLDEKGKYLGIPTLVVEVVSPGNTVKEMMTKLDLYKDSGIEEYWIVNDKKKQVLIYHFNNYEIIGTKIYKANDLCQSFIYKDFQISINKLIDY